MTEVQEFSTSSVAPANRISSWEAASARLLHKISVSTPGAAPLDARIRSTRADESTVAEVRARRHVVGRSPGDVSSWPTGAVAIAAQLGPAAHGDGLGAHRSVTTGEVMVFDADVPFRRAYDQGMHLLMWLVPRPDFLEAVCATTAVSRVLDPRPGGSPDPRVATLAVTMIRGARWHDDADAAHGSPASSAPVPDSLSPAGDWRPADVLEALRLCVPGAAPSLRSYFLLARHLVDRRLSDPDLGAEAIAAGIGISERHLSRVLASEGTSAPRLVTDRRLARTRLDLRNPALGDVPVADLGRRWGLGTPAHLSRVYRDRFGVSPREDRPRSGGYAIPRAQQHLA